ncbi:glycosyltransferase family 2 protein [Luteimonas sp. MC1825]|uniref:glycosyltransferase family 2 protein n=1 Tax=Luteimonas sp. MC1825 TaxID=2761107 RepID=UPI001C889653|nr:glycosyltransferase family 2 protein [Luteimonas sp. MC1825]
MAMKENSMSMQLAEGVPGTARPNAGAWVVVPAYNESTSIGPVVRGALAHVDGVVVVDDASADDTGEQARLAGAVVLRHPVNLGQGAALQTGISHALAEGARYIVMFDADGQHEAAEIDRMLAALRDSKVDVALGSRFKGTTVGMPRLRRVVLKLAIAFTRLTTGLKLSDSHNGFRAFTADAARQLRIRQNRMAHASEILEQIGQRRLTFVEVPVTIRYTDYSKRKGQGNSESLNILLDLMTQWIRK